MANQQATIGAEPRDGAFNDPTMAIRPQPAVVFVETVDVVGAVRTGEHNAPAGELLAERVAVVAAIADQVLGVPAVRRYTGCERGVDERDFRRRRRGNGDSQRNTLTLDQYHAL